MAKRGLAGMVIAAIGAATVLPSALAAERPVVKPGPSIARVATTQPTSAPTTEWTVPVLAGDLSILSTRSMFLHGRPPSQVASTHPGGGGPGAPALILRGVARQGEHLLAFVEDSAAHQTKQLHIGDALGAGKLVAITNDGVDRSIGGKVSHVKVGQPIEVMAGGPERGGPPGLMPGGGPNMPPGGVAHAPPGVDNEPSAANTPPVATAVDPAAPPEVSVPAGAKIPAGRE